MAVPLIAGATTIGRGLAAYLAKKGITKGGRGFGVLRKPMIRKSAMHPRDAAFLRARGRTYPMDGTMSGGKHIANRFVNAPSGVSKFAKRMGIGALAAGSFLAGDEYGKRHPRVEAMEDLRIPNAGRVGFAPDKGLLQIDPNTGLRTVTGVHGTVEEQKAAYFAEIANDPNAPMDQRVSALLRLETGAAYTAEEANAAAETLRAHDIQNLNMTQGGKQMLMDDLRNQTGAGVTEHEIEKEVDAIEEVVRGKTGAGYTGGELNTFMGIAIPRGTEAKKWRSNMDEYEKMYNEAITAGDANLADRILRKMSSL